MKKEVVEFVRMYWPESTCHYSGKERTMYITLKGKNKHNDAEAGIIHFFGYSLPFKLATN